MRLILEQAFETPAEASLLDRLRARRKLVVSLAAEEGGGVVGDNAFSEVSLSSRPEHLGFGLDPMAVAAGRWVQDVGSMLVREGLPRCRDLGYEFAVVLGHSKYYPRFGFVPACRIGITSKWDVPEGVFMAIELRPQLLTVTGGVVTYSPEFNDV